MGSYQVQYHLLLENAPHNPSYTNIGDFRPSCQLTGDTMSKQSLDMLYLRYIHENLQNNGSNHWDSNCGPLGTQKCKPYVLTNAPQRHKLET